MKRVFIYINGILNVPGDSEGWTDRAVTWTNIHTDWKGEKYEYLAGALTRRFLQQRRAEKLAKMISFYNGENSPAPGEWEVNVIAHSNGCDVSLRTLQLLQERRWRTPDCVRLVNALHLVSPACEADCLKNGLVAHLASDLVGSVTVRVAGSDRAMIGAQISAWIGKPFGLGYGTLGKTGPLNTPASGLTVITEPDFGHSTWFKPQHFDRFMKGITE